MRVPLVFVCSLVGVACNAQVESNPALPLKRVVIYRNGVGYFERQGRVSRAEVNFRVKQHDVGDFLATLAVMEQGGSSVRAAAFPMPEELAPNATPRPDARRTVRLSLDGNRHNLVVGYAVETPIWRPSYRLVFSHEGAQMQAWGIVQNVSGEDWNDVRLSLVTGAPVSFRSELAQAVVPLRPLVSDQGAVIDAVPTSETTLGNENLAARETPAAAAAVADAPGNMPSDAIGDAFGYGGLGAQGTGWGGGGAGEGTIGMGNIGTIGHGSGQGYGSGAGFGLRDRGGGPIVRAQPPSVAGPLAPEAIRRVVLRNLGQITHCYEQGLAQSPSLTGRVVIHFVIAPNGAVASSLVGSSTQPQVQVSECMANAVRRWQFPSPEGGAMVTVDYPFLLQNDASERHLAQAATIAPAAPVSAAPRNVASLAGLSTQGGSTRFDLPNPVTIPDHSATMVMLAARNVPGERLFLFAPDPGVADSASHPFHVARFENRSGAMLERGPIAIFEEGAFLGQGMMDALPDGATATIPFALNRGISVERRTAETVEGARLISMRRSEVHIERFNVRRSNFHVRNGSEQSVRVLVRENLNGAELFEPPQGTENSNGNALAPCPVNARGEADVIVTSRTAFATQVDLGDEQARVAIEQFLRDGHPTPEVTQALRTALELRESLQTLTQTRADLERRRNDLEESADETRQNLDTILRNPQAADLRAQLTSRLGRVATEVDTLTRRIVELDVQLSERQVRMQEAVRAVDIDIARPPAPLSAAPAPHTP